MKHRQKQGQPTGSRNVRVTPEFREKPDVEKLGRALIALALRIAERKKAEEEALVDDGKGDTVA